MARKRTLDSDAINGAAWQEFRLTILDRDGWTCQICRSPLHRGHGPQSATVDHITPRSEGGWTSPENCRALCARCNGIKSRAEAANSALRKREEAGREATGEETPEPEPCPHHDACREWHSRDW
ncbi:HNH endonuclease [Microbispora bryophytorum]|uniref:HNH endonuclease n=1 Tax=Microbispora bryophytorum TaxID=1460882 RepID=UPI0033C2E527